MNTNKLESFTVKGNIHTVEIRVRNIICEPQDQNTNHKYFSCLSQVKSDTGEVTSTCRINVSNFGFGEVLSISKFEEVVQQIIKIVGIEDYSYSRIDFKFDSNDGKDFEPYLKINKLLTLLFTLIFTIKSKNAVESSNLFTGDVHSIWISNNDIEIQFYDKTNQTEGERKCARFELRKKRLKACSPNLIYPYWRKRLDKLADQFEMLQQLINDKLIEVYQRDKNKTPSKFRNHNDFALQHQTVIFCHNQLVDLFQRMGLENSEVLARNFKQRYRIEYFSKKDIESFLVKYKNALKNYFLN